MGYDMKMARLEMFARVSHSITGCIEAPLQMVMTISLMLMEVLPLPWERDSHRATIQDTYGNRVDLYIPAITLLFSVIDMIKCAIMINIFNVYVGQLESLSTYKYYINIAAGHLPFFLHAICLRVLAYSFFVIYLNEFSMIPVILIWFSNLVIGKIKDKTCNYEPLYYLNRLHYKETKAIKIDKSCIEIYQQLRKEENLHSCI